MINLILIEHDATSVSDLVRDEYFKSPLIKEAAQATKLTLPFSMSVQKDIRNENYKKIINK